MFYVIILLLVAETFCNEEEHVEFEPFPDYYAMLNVSHDAGMKEIKRSFRKLAMGFHPDKNKTENAQLIFQELSEAYSVLSDVEKKAEYDELFRHFYDLSQDDVPVENPENDSSDEQPFEDGNSSQKKASDETDKTEKKTEESSSTEKEDGPHTDKDNDSEMDDETLFKVLKFLAENDYVITKRTKRTLSNPDDSSYNSDGESRSKRSADSTNSRTYSEYRTSHNASGGRGHAGGYHGQAGGHHGQAGGHQGHDHAWTHSHQHKPRAEHQNARYGNQFHGSEQVYCRSTVRYEGNVKITSKTCL